jgi:hypothetical protein
MGYGGLTKFIIIDDYVGFPEKEYNITITDVVFHTVSSAPTLYKVNIRL